MSSAYRTPPKALSFRPGRSGVIVSQYSDPISPGGTSYSLKQVPFDNSKSSLGTPIREEVVNVPSGYYESAKRCCFFTCWHVSLDLVLEVGQIDSLYLLSILEDAANLERVRDLSAEAPDSGSLVDALVDWRVYFAVKLLAGLVSVVQVFLACLVFCGVFNDEAQSYNLSVYRTSWLFQAALYLLSAIVFLMSFKNVMRARLIGGKETPIRAALRLLFHDYFGLSEWFVMIVELALFLIVFFPTGLGLSLYIATSMDHTLWLSFAFIILWGGVRSLLDPYDMAFHSIMVVLTVSIMSQAESMLYMFMDFLVMEFIMMVDALALENLRHGILGGRARRIFQKLEGPVVLRLPARLLGCTVFVVYFVAVVVMCSALITTAPPAYIERNSWVRPNTENCLNCLPVKHALIRAPLQGLFIDTLREGTCQYSMGEPMPPEVGSWQLFHELTPQKLNIYAAPRHSAKADREKPLQQDAYSVPCDSIANKRLMIEVPRTSPYSAVTTVNFERAWNFSKEGITEYDVDFYPPERKHGVNFQVQVDVPGMTNALYKQTDCWYGVPEVQEIVLYLEGNLGIPNATDQLNLKGWLAWWSVVLVCVSCYFMLPVIRMYRKMGWRPCISKEDSEDSDGEESDQEDDLFRFLIGDTGHAAYET